MKRLMTLFGGGLLACLFVGSLSPQLKAAVDKAPATIKVIVPPGGSVEFDGQKSKQTGPKFEFVTPDLDLGKKYSYSLKAIFPRDGVPVTVERTLSVEGGKETTLDLSQSAGEKASAYIKVIVPPGGTVAVDGVKSRQTGPKFEFASPELEIGKKYTYQLTVDYRNDGKPVTLDRTVVVEAGKEVVVDLTEGITPLKVEKTVVKEEPKPVVKEEPKPIVKEEPRPIVKEEPKPIVKDEPKPAVKEAPKVVAKTEPKKIEPTIVKDEPKPIVKDEPRKEVRLDVPYVPTPQPVVDAMLNLANVTEKDVVYDLGCGDGRIVITAVKKYKAKSGLGVEIFPERVKLSRENAKKEGVEKQVEIQEGSVLDLKDVSGASVVTLYLLPNINRQLMPMLRSTLKPGSRIVSHDFDMGNWKPDKEISVKDQLGREHTLYLWTIRDEDKSSKKPLSGDFQSSESLVAFHAEDKPVQLDVPYVPTPEPVVDAMLKLAGVGEKDVVYDLGCGDGRIVITAVKKYKAKSGLGVELFPERVRLSRENAKKEGVEKQVEIREGSVLDLKDVSEASVVTLYLLPSINLKLMPMLKKTLKPGARIVSHDFDMGDWKADKKIEVEADGIGHTIYLWTIPEEKK